MDDDHVWHIHGNRYDLHPFLKSHPGGETILILARGERDMTPLFESYHAFSNRTAIRKQLEQYRVYGPGREELYTYDLYETLVQRARRLFGAEDDSSNVTAQIKSSEEWMGKVLGMFICMLVLWAFTFVYPIDQPYRPLLSLFTGYFSLMTTFGVIHDSTHLALFSKNHWVQRHITHIFAGIVCFSSNLWMKHHVVRHHAHTGHKILDPDEINFEPFFERSNHGRKRHFFPWMNDLVYTVYILFCYLIFPGSYIGNLIMYYITWPIKGTMWRVAYPGGDVRTSVLEWAVICVAVSVHFIHPSLLTSALYFVGLNLGYISITIGNHDPLIRQSTARDWAIVQVNHCNNVPYSLFPLTEAIDNHAEHHLFPTVSSSKQPLLHNMVAETCKEFGVVFNQSETYWESIVKSFQNYREIRIF